MFKRFTTKELIFIALLAALTFVVNFVFGAAIVAMTGVPLASGFFTGLMLGICGVLLFKTVPKPGTFTLFFLIYSILEIPTALGGAPGFWPKIPINAISGLLGDLWLMLWRYRTWSIFPAFYLITVANFSAFLYFLWLLGLPGVEKTAAIIHWVILAYWVVGTIGMLLGFRIYKQIKNKQFVKQISG